MYSRKFYGTDRVGRRGVAQAPQSTPAKATGVGSVAARGDSDTFPRWALNVPATDDGDDTEKIRIEPKDFLPEKEDTAAVYPERPPTESAPDDAENQSPEVIEEIQIGSAGAYEKTADMPSLRSMTLEDMLLTGLLMLGSSGEYDDEIMLILGLILMIGA